MVILILLYTDTAASISISENVVILSCYLDAFSTVPQNNIFFVFALQACLVANEGGRKNIRFHCTDKEVILECL